MPWSFGFTLLGLSKRVRLPERDLVTALAALVECGRLVHRDGYYMTPGFVPKLTEEQSAFFAPLFIADEAALLLPVAYVSIMRKIKEAKVVGLSQALDTLLTVGMLVRVGDDVYRDTQIAEIRLRLEDALRFHGKITPAQFRDTIGTSRKYALPLLAWFDAMGVTVRVPDGRESSGG